MATEERVLCFQRQLLEKTGVFQGIEPPEMPAGAAAEQQS